MNKIEPTWQLTHVTEFHTVSWVGILMFVFIVLLLVGPICYTWLNIFKVKTANLCLSLRLCCWHRSARFHMLSRSILALPIMTWTGNQTCFTGQGAAAMLASSLQPALRLYRASTVPCLLLLEFGVEPLAVIAFMLL